MCRYRPYGTLLRYVLLCALVALPRAQTYADVVVPSADVVTRVIVRGNPSSQSIQVGSLSPGEQVELIGSVPNWHEVQLTNGTLGFVSKRWTRVIPAAPPVPPPPSATPTFTMDVIDVGTGLAVLVRGEDFTLVYDGGSNDDLARGPSNRLLAYLKAVAPELDVIDHLILSHPHRDHVELLPDLFDAYEVRQVWDSGRINDICGYRAFLTAVRDEPGVQYHNALQDFGTGDYGFAKKTCYGQALPDETLQLTHAGRINESPVTLGHSATMRVLHADGADHSSANENSLVVRLNLDSSRVLLMGDAEAGGRQNPSAAPSGSSIEGTLVTCCEIDLAAEVLVVGHHGSKTSSRRTFLDAVSASVFIVSSGPMKYGSVTLPDAEIITELSSRGEVFRTDADDPACKTNPAKIGPDADERAGGCDNVRVTIAGTAPLQVSLWHGAEP